MNLRGGDILRNYILLVYVSAPFPYLPFVWETIQLNVPTWNTLTSTTICVLKHSFFGGRLLIKTQFWVFKLVHCTPCHIVAFRHCCCFFCCKSEMTKTQLPAVQSQRRALSLFWGKHKGYEFFLKCIIWYIWDRQEQIYQKVSDNGQFITIFCTEI